MLKSTEHQSRTHLIRTLICDRGKGWGCEGRRGEVREGRNPGGEFRKDSGKREEWCEIELHSFTQRQQNYNLWTFLSHPSQTPTPIGCFPKSLAEILPPFDVLRGRSQESTSLVEEKGFDGFRKNTVDHKRPIKMVRFPTVSKATFIPSNFKQPKTFPCSYLKYNYFNKKNIILNKNRAINYF